MSYQQVVKGATGVSVELRFLDVDGLPATVDHATSGLALWYRRDGEAKTTITAAALAALTTAWTSGGVEPISDGSSRIDVPDAAFATGVDKVVIGGSATGLTAIPCYVDLFDSVTIAAGGVKVTEIGADVITATAIQAAAFTAAKFGSGALVKGTVITGFNDLDAAGVRAAVGLASASLDTQLGSLQVYPKNVAASNFSFPMFLTNGNLATGVAITGQIMKDAGTFTTLTNAIAEVGATGVFRVNITQAEMNGDEIFLLFTGAGCRPLPIKIKTQA